MRKFADHAFERHAVLQRHAGERADGVHESAERAAFFLHLDEEFAGLAILEHADGDVAFVAGDIELVGERDTRVRHALAQRLLGFVAEFGEFALEFADSAAEALVFVGDGLHIGDCTVAAAVGLFVGGDRCAAFRAVAVNRDRLQT